MKILFDHNVPRKLRRLLRGHVVRTAFQMGWATVENGTLIRAAEEAGFDLFLTSDQGILYQQNHTARRIPIVLLSSNYWPDVQASAASIQNAIEQCVAGGFVLLEISRRKPNSDASV